MTLATVGTPLHECDTPMLCIDLDIMDANIASMANHITSRGKEWRPHSKCHKTPAIVHKQMAAGALGVTCAKLAEAEVMAAAGIKDILIANMIVGRSKVQRAAALCKHADPILSCDHFAQVEPLAAACREIGVSCRVIVELNIGLDRVGIRPGQDALELAKAIDKQEGVTLAGIMGYEGHLLTVEDQAEKKEKIFEAMNVLVQARDMLLNVNLNCDLVSAGGTGSYQISSDCPGITELQAGGGIFADPMYRDSCNLQGLEYSLSVLTTIVSRPTRSRAVSDAGRKSHHPDFHLPVVKNCDDAKVTSVSAEHCTYELSGAAEDWKIGDKIEIVPGYADFTSVMHENFYGFRNGVLEVIWPIAGRGKLW